MINPAFVLGLADITIDDRAAVGGKGASLGELTRAGLRVPPGCVVTTSAFTHALRSLDLDRAIRGAVEHLRDDDPAILARVTADIRQQIDATPLPEDLRAAIGAHYRALDVESDASGSAAPVAVRSSATGEDAADASFAGLQDTYLWVRGEEAVFRHVRKCWASLYSLESVSYRRRRRMAEQDMAMGVVIQRMIDARCAGVMFTRSPTTGDRSVVALEASWGLGSAVVSGEVTPDTYVVSKVTSEIVRRTVSAKLRQHRPNPNGVGVLDDEVPAYLRSEPCLGDDEIHALVEVGCAVERLYGTPQDIEWAISRDIPSETNIFILQSRPETFWANREAALPITPRERAFDHVFSLLGRGPGAHR
jgi:pyruvate,water dikinase